MGFNNAEVLVKFVGKTEDLDKKTDEASNIIKGFGKGVSGILKGIGALSIATSALIVAEVLKGIGDMVSSSVKAYSTFEQLEGGLVSLFGEGSKEMNRIIEQSEQAYKNLTMSQNDYLNAFQTSYPLVNAGLSENADAIEYTNKALQLSSDLFNTYGGSIEYYQSAINWALKGSFVYLDNLNLGIKGTQEGFIEAANASGILNRQIQSTSELTNDEIIDVIQHYAEAYGVWGKTSQEASTTILGSMNMVKATWDNFILGLSKSDADINGLIDNVVNSALTFADNVVPIVMRAINAIATALPKIAQVIADILPNLVDSLLPPLVDAVVGLLQGLIKVLPRIVKTLMKEVLRLLEEAIKLLPDLIDVVLAVAVSIIETLAEELPTLLPTIIDAIIEAILKITEYVPQVIQAAIELLMGIIKAIPTIITQLLEALPNIIKTIITCLLDAIPELIKGAIELFFALIKAIPIIILELGKQLPEIIKAIIEAITSNESLKNIYNAGVELFFKIIDGIKAYFSNIWDTGKELVVGLWNGINDKVNWIVEKIKGFGESVIEAIKGIFGIASPSKEFEWIGKMNMVGLEQGMEDMKSQVQSTIDSVFSLQPNVSGSMSSTYSPQMNVIVQNNMEYDPIGQLVSNVKTFSGGAKNDYNWGAGL